MSSALTPLFTQLRSTLRCISNKRNAISFSLLEQIESTPADAVARHAVDLSKHSTSSNIHDNGLFSAVCNDSRSYHPTAKGSSSVSRVFTRCDKTQEGTSITSTNAHVTRWQVQCSIFRRRMLSSRKPLMRLCRCRTSVS